MPLTPDTKFSTTLAKVITSVAAMSLAVWSVRGYVADQKQAQSDMLTELRDIKREISTLNTDAVTQRQFEAWAGKMRWENRQTNLIVPEPREFASR